MRNLSCEKLKKILKLLNRLANRDLSRSSTVFDSSEFTRIKTKKKTAEQTNQRSFTRQFRLTTINGEEGRQLADSLKEAAEDHQEEAESDSIFVVEDKILEEDHSKDLHFTETTPEEDFKAAEDHQFEEFLQFIIVECHKEGYLVEEIHR